MPTNKNAQLRYQVLDRCFSDFTHKYTIDELLDKVNESLYDIYNSKVQLRQIREDIKYMRDRVFYNAPIKAYQLQGKKCYYRYEDSNFSIFKNELSVKEIEMLRSTINMLGKYRSIAKNDWLEEVISNLEYRFGIKSNKENIISFDQNNQLRGLEFLSELIDSAVNHNVLQIVYRTFKGVEKTSIVHPYHIKQYNNRWYLFALNQSEIYGNQITNMALDRIVSFSRKNDIKFIENTQFDFSTMFDDIIGVTIPENHPNAEKVLLKFDAARFPYIISKPIHPSQEIIDQNNCIISLTIRPNKELESQIFFFGPQVEVIEPLWFRNQIAEKIEKTYKNYFNMQKECTENN